MPIIYIESKGMGIRNMEKTSKKSGIALDKSVNIVYNTSMKNTNNNNEKEMKMTKFRDYAEKVASQMKKGLSNENSQICEIGRVLRDSGLSHVEVNYHMNVDEDFIPDVLQSYNPPKKRVNSIQLINNLNPWIRHPKKT